jgi:Polyketide cyclase / dehydrase and lipid transport
MGVNTASAQGPVAAPPEVVYRYLSDMHNHHPHFLPPAFSDFQVVAGGIGDGTVVTFQFAAGGRRRNFRQTLTEPEPGRRMVETDANSSTVTTFVVDPVDAGKSSKVTISTQWNGARGIGGFFERVFAPRAMRGIYIDQIRRLDEYARTHP